MLSTASLQRDRDKQHARTYADTARLHAEMAARGEEVVTVLKLHRDGTLHAQHYAPLKQTGT